MHTGIETIINRYCMLKAGDRVLIGISGGPDSVFLLYILKDIAPQYKLRLFAAHINHGLRGIDSDADEAFCRKLCGNMDIPLFVKKAHMKKGVSSIEDRARRIRYDFFIKTAGNISADKIALAHNADDQAETVIMRLLRGAGARGLSGIPPKRRAGGAYIIRPLIEMWKNDITDYLKKRNIPYRIDRTNTNLCFLRNRIRHSLMRILSEYNSNIKSILCTAGKNMYEVRDYMEKEAEKKFRRYASVSEREISIESGKLRKMHPALAKEIMRKAVYTVNPSFCPASDQMETLIRIIKGEEGTKKVFLGKGIDVIREYKRIIFTKRKSAGEGYCFSMPVPGRIEIPEYNILISSRLYKNKYPGRRNPFEAELDYDKITFPLVIRSRRPGDSYRPSGYSGRKKLKDIFIDEKVPERYRGIIPVAVSGGDICWVAGYRVAERFKAAERTEMVLNISARGVKKLWQI